jgi:nucleoid-associated protein YgaU
VAAPAPPPPAPPPAAPAPPPVVEPPRPSPRELLTAEHRDRAAALEREGHLRRALDEWKIALTVTPGDPAAEAGRRALEARIERVVGERLQQGREALGRGDHVEARRHFLAALAADPFNAAAFGALQADVKEIRFLSHTVRRGETLASLAERYYGDRARAEVIWETNQLPPSPRLAPGVVLRIPEIPGVPFVHEARPARPAAPTAPAPASPEVATQPGTPAPPAAGEVARAEPAREGEVYQNPLLLSAREALERGEFSVALADVDRALASGGSGPDGLDLKKSILYGLGKSQLGQRRYDESYRTLSQLAALAPSYQDSAALLRQARDNVVTSHYTRGLRLYQEEKLEAAIAEWRTVLEYDPQHANARKNIDQAERLLRALQQRQQQRRQ